MSRPACNKTFLKQESDRLGLYRRFLPALDLKRQQFLALLTKERRRPSDMEQQIAARHRQAGQWLGFLAARPPAETPPLMISDVRLSEENVLGVRLPVLEDVLLQKREPALLATPLWHDTFVQTIAAIVRLRLARTVIEERIRILHAALQTLSRRVNLFDKVLIPDARATIRRIRIVLDDMERAGVVRAKIAKKKQGGGSSGETDLR